MEWTRRTGQSHIEYNIRQIEMSEMLKVHSVECLTFKNRASYIYIGRAYRYPPNIAFYIYFFNKYKYWVF